MRGPTVDEIVEMVQLERPEEDLEEDEDDEEEPIQDSEDDYEPRKKVSTNGGGGGKKRSAVNSGNSTPSGSTNGGGGNKRGTKRQKGSTTTTNAKGKGKKVAPPPLPVDQYVEYGGTTSEYGSNEGGGVGGEYFENLHQQQQGAGGQLVELGAGQVLQQGLAADEAEPLYVNAKQYHRILKRRLARARLEEMGRLSRERKVSSHISLSRSLSLLTCSLT
jgi:hypothetical protein